MTEERKILTVSLTAAAAAAAVPAALGVLKNLKPQPMADCDRLRLANAGFADAAGAPVALHAISLPSAPTAFLREGAACPPAQAEAALIARFGPYGAKQLLHAEVFGALPAADLQTLKGLGVNCVRLPLRSDLLLKKANGKETIDFTAMDGLVARCSAAGVYVLPALTALPAALLQPGKPGNEARSLVQEQWRQIAAHYCDEAAIAGYELLADLPQPDADAQALLLKFCGRLLPALQAADADRPLLLPLPAAVALRGDARIAAALTARSASPAQRAALRSQLPAGLPCMVTVSSADAPSEALAAFTDQAGLCFEGFFGPRGCLFAAFTGEAPDLVTEDYKALTAKCAGTLHMANLQQNAALCSVLRATFGGAIETPQPKTAFRFGLHPRTEDGNGSPSSPIKE